MYSCPPIVGHTPGTLSFDFGHDIKRLLCS